MQQKAHPDKETPLVSLNCDGSKMSRFSKRGRNPGAVDFWLESLGYYRKNVAYDETCLFRAVAEQLNLCQVGHETIRKHCIIYGKQHSKEFAHLVPKKKNWYEHLRQLTIHMIVCGELEIQLLSCAFSANITVFNSVSHDKKEYSPLSNCNSKHQLLLCQMGEDHYDAVYPKEHIVNAGFCQSIVYNLLYENILGVPDAEAVAHSMLHDKQIHYVPYNPETNRNDSRDDGFEKNEEDQAHQPCMLAPFPFKIAKALDPNMYRNIEYDTWIEQRREMRLGDWYYGDNNLILGTRCLLNVDGEELECYIQTIYEEDKSKCEVYITKLAKRLTVNYTELKPENNAKPWPLPYRFSRTQSPALSELSLEIDKKSLRKGREKKHLQQQNSEQSSSKSESKETSPDVNVSNYAGYPLLMQSSTKSTSSEQGSLIINKPDKEQSESPPPSDNILWPQSPTRDSELYQVIQNDYFNYQDSSAEVLYNYSEGENTYPPMMAMWSPANQYLMTPDSAIGEEVIKCEKPEVASKYVYYPTDSAYGSPTYPSSLPSTPYALSPYPVPYTNDRIMCTTPTIPTEMVPMMYAASAPGTPIYYPPSPAQVPPPPPPPLIPRPSEYNVMSMTQPPPTFAIYTPPAMEVPYVSPGRYVYSAGTPSVTWFNHPSINSQGFIFPTPVSSHNNNV